MFEIQQRFAKLSLFDKCFHTVLVFLLVASAGFPTIKSRSLDYLIFLLCITGVVYYNANVRKSISYIACFALLLLIQTTYFGETYISTAIYQLMLFMSGAFSVSVLGTSLIYIYQRIIVFFTAASLVLFIPILVNFNFSLFLINNFPFAVTLTEEHFGVEDITYNIFFLTFPADFFDGLVRNSGPFWEPGAFGGFLILSIIINTLLEDKLFTKRNLLFFAGVITTFSTTTYLAIFFFASAFYYFKIQDKLLKSIIVLSLGAGFYFAFNSLSFLGPKIENELADIQFEALMFGGNSRTASAYLDLKEMAEKSFYLLFGRGSLADFRIAGSDKEVLRNNGVTDLLVRVGIPFFIFLLYTLRKSFKSIAEIGYAKNYASYVAFATFMILSIGETYFKFSFFWALILFCTWQGEKLPIREGRLFKRSHLRAS